jgi:2-polyprenyl-3-methyl-5-hydroxy-6-metoxy-1,4-benzoquinol methylase
MQRSDFTIRLPHDAHGLAQTEEYFILVQERTERRLRLHDYREIYNVPGLYDHLLSDLLQCTSPEVIAGLLSEEVGKRGLPIAELIALDLGAGTGLVGAALQQQGVRRIVGIDILPEACEAAHRDRPGVYWRYYVEDMCNLTAQAHQELTATRFNAMVCVSALGLSHVPTAVFTQGYNLVARDGWIAFNFKPASASTRDVADFPHFISRVIEAGLLDLQVSHSYRHRLAVDGSPVNYVAMVGRKRANIPPDFTLQV